MWRRVDPRWAIAGLTTAAAAIALLAISPRLLFVLAWAAAIASANRSRAKWAGAGRLPRQPYRPRDTGAGRWLEAPVAELDKSTIGKLLASRASRDPGLRVVVRNTTPPPCTDALYDPEIDG